MWVGTGFLAPIGLFGPADALYSAVSGGGVVPGHSLVRPWVYHLVYTGFACEAIFLLAAFALYAVDRWPGAFRGRAAGSLATPGLWLQPVLARVAAVLAATAGTAYLAWACGVTAGLPARVAAGEGFSSRMTQAGFGVMAMLGAVGIIVLARNGGIRPGRHRRQLTAAVLAAWVGTGSMFAWGSWATINALGQTPLSQAGGTGAAFVNLVGLAELLAGLLAGVLLAIWLAESTSQPR